MLHRVERGAVDPQGRTQMRQEDQGYPGRRRCLASSALHEKPPSSCSALRWRLDRPVQQQKSYEGEVAHCRPNYLRCLLGPSAASESSLSLSVDYLSGLSGHSVVEEALWATWIETARA